MRITITIDVDGQGQVSINAGHETTEKQITETTEAKPATAPAPKVEPKAEAKPAPAPKAEAKPKAEVKPAPAPKTEPAQAPAPAQEEPEDSAVTLDDIREAAKEKINKHRDAIKAKLMEYGANNISSLSPEYFEDFYVFLSCELK